MPRRCAARRADSATALGRQGFAWAGPACLPSLVARWVRPRSDRLVRLARDRAVRFHGAVRGGAAIGHALQSRHSVAAGWRRPPVQARLMSFAAYLSTVPSPTQSSAGQPTCVSPATRRVHAPRSGGKLASAAERRQRHRFEPRPPGCEYSSTATGTPTASVRPPAREYSSTRSGLRPPGRQWRGRRVHAAADVRPVQAPRGCAAAVGVPLPPSFPKPFRSTAFPMKRRRQRAHAAERMIEALCGPG